MLIKLGDNQVNLEDVEYSEPNISKHTGSRLEKFSFDINVRGSKKEWLDEVIADSKNGGVYSIDDSENVLKEYKIVNNSLSYRANYLDENTVYSYTIYLEQIEKLEIKNLIIAGISLLPYKYSEEYDNAIIINANVRIPKEVNEQLEKTIGDNRYFEVKRDGISTETKIMRFGKTIWSEDGDFIKKHLVLVEDIHDDKENPINYLFQPELSNIFAELAKQQHINQSLLNLLVSKGMMTTDEINSLKTDADNNYKDLLMLFYEVDDIDTF